GAGGTPPGALPTLADGARAVAGAAAAGDWPAASARVGAMAATWKQAGRSGGPELLGKEMAGALDALAAAVRGHDPAAVRRGAPAGSGPTPPRGPAAGSPGTWPPSRFSGTAPPTSPTPPPQLGSRRP